jgi:DNA-binding Lrp family transcriptional regulator
VDDVRLLEAIIEKGRVDCSGNCRVRKPGEIHCNVIAAQLQLSPTSVKERIQDLLGMGLILRERVDVGTGTASRIITRFTVSPLGKKTVETSR